MGTDFQFCKKQKVLETDGDSGSTTIRMYLRALNAHLEMVKVMCFV